MGPDRHLVCWEISLGWSERLPSPLPAPAYQMWGEGHIASSLCSAAWVRFPSAFPHAGRRTHSWFIPHAYLCVGIHTLVFGRAWVQFNGRYKTQNTGTFIIDFPHLCSSPPSPLLLRTILHRSEATSSFCWLVRLRLGSCSWQALLSERLNSRYATKACWSSSQYSRLHGTWKESQSSHLTNTTHRYAFYLGCGNKQLYEQYKDSHNTTCAIWITIEENKSSADVYCSVLK